MRSSSFRESNHNDREPKWMSAIKFGACFAVIQVNASLFGLLRERILTSHAFPSSLFLVFASQFASFVVAALVCTVRRHSYAQLALAEAGPVDAIRRVPLIQFALIVLSDSIGRSLQIETKRAHQVSFPVVALMQSSKVLGKDMSVHTYPSNSCLYLAFRYSR